MKFRLTTRLSMLLTALVLLTAFPVQAQFFSSKELSSAKLYYQQKQYDKAKEFIQKAVEKNPKNSEAFYYKALICSELKELKEQAFAAKQALELGGLKEAEQKNCNIMIMGAWANTFNAGVAAGNNNDVDEAVKQYTLAAEILPDSVQSYYYMFVAQYNAKRYDDAMKSLETYIAKSHETKEILQYMLTIETMKVRPITSIYDSLMTEFKTKKATYLASKDKKKPPFDNSDSVSAAKIWTDAAAQYEKMLELLDKYKASKYVDNSWILETKAQIYIDSKRADEALSIFLDAANASPNNEVLQYNVGVLYFGKKDYDNAIKHFNNAVSIKPDYIDAVYNLGAAYLNKGLKIQGELEDAYAKEKDRKKKDAIGKDKSYLEFFKLALPNLEKVQEVRKDDSQFWYTLGKVYTTLGDKAKAQNAFDRASKGK